MKIGSKDVAMGWLNEKGLVNQENEIIYAKLGKSFSYLIPVDAGKKTSLASLLANFIKKESEGMLWISAYGIWPSSQNLDLFYGYRKSINELRPIHEAPCHLFGKNDTSTFESLLGLTLYFYWDVLVVEGSGDVVIKLSHDEVMTIFSRDDDRLAILKNEFEKRQFRGAGVPLRKLPPNTMVSNNSSKSYRR